MAGGYPGYPYYPHQSHQHAEGGAPAPPASPPPPLPQGELIAWPSWARWACCMEKGGDHKPLFPSPFGQPQSFKTRMLMQSHAQPCLLFGLFSGVPVHP
eukprot:163354-Pelagomonas_calceolata.AAC.2